MIDIILIFVLGFVLAEACRQAFHAQHEEILRLHVYTMLENGEHRTGYHCRSCRMEFTAYPVLYAVCPNCRGRVRIRLPRG